MDMKKITKYIILVTIFAVALISAVWYGRQYRLQRQLAEKVLRFHVLANSDEKADQELKLSVRDAIGSFMQENMQNVESKEECEAFLELNPDAEILLLQYDQSWDEEDEEAIMNG